jgi:sensor domain CHASE-containing protein
VHISLQLSVMIVVDRNRSLHYSMTMSGTHCEYLGIHLHIRIHQLKIYARNRILRISSHYLALNVIP